MVSSNCFVYTVDTWKIPRRKGFATPGSTKALKKYENLSIPFKSTFSGTNKSMSFLVWCNPVYYIESKCSILCTL